MLGQKEMRCRSKRSRLCRIAVGTLCVAALVHLLWVRGHFAGVGLVTVDNGRRQASGSSVWGEVAETQSPNVGLTGAGHISSKFPASDTDEASIKASTTMLTAYQVLEDSDLQDMIHDPSKVKITPKQPVVLEGHPIKFTCVTSHLLKGNASAAPYMTIQLPTMSRRDKRVVRLQLRPGGAMVTIRSVREGHRGRYTCIMVDQDGKHRYNTAQLHIKKRTGDDDGEDEVNEEEYDDGVMGGMDIQDADPRDVVLERAQILKLREQLDGEFINTDVNRFSDVGKLQEDQVNKFCVKYNLSHQEYQLPRENESEKSLYRHLLIYDKMKTLFAFVPKTGCTNLRLLFFRVQGYIPFSQFLQSRDSVDQNRLEAAQFQESFFSRNDQQRSYALKHYFKFVMYRNPLDRLVSGYRSKVARYPLMGLSREKPHYNWLRNDIVLRTQPKKYLQYIQRRGNISINVSFSDFIEYWVEQPKEIKFDEHFRSIFSITQPCRVRYNFYGNFKNFEKDTLVLVYKIKAHLKYLRHSYYSNTTSTEEMSPILYAQLTKEQKLKVLKVLARDLEFYYTIFPQEKDIHKTLLGVTEDLPIIDVAG